MTMEARAGLKGSDRWLKSERLELAQLSFGEGQQELHLHEDEVVKESVLCSLSSTTLVEL